MECVCGIPVGYLWIPVGYLWDSCGILVGFLWVIYIVHKPYLSLLPISEIPYKLPLLYYITYKYFTLYNKKARLNSIYLGIYLEEVDWTVYITGARARLHSRFQEMFWYISELILCFIYFLNENSFTKKYLERKMYWKKSTWFYQKNLFV